jgi:hypothetical protein
VDGYDGEVEGMGDAKDRRLAAGNVLGARCVKTTVDCNIWNPCRGKAKLRCICGCSSVVSNARIADSLLR